MKVDSFSVKKERYVNHIFECFNIKILNNTVANQNTLIRWWFFIFNSSLIFFPMHGYLKENLHVDYSGDFGKNVMLAHI